MRDLDLKIADRGGVYVVKARGRANFEYAVPLRELVKNLAGFERFCIDLSECTAMDSTFMGVLTMTALKGAKCGKKVEILGASDVLQKLLRDLGVGRLFSFAGVETAPEELLASLTDAQGGASMLAGAETVKEAHESLVDADQANAERFESVIKYAEADVERLKK